MTSIHTPDQLEAYLQRIGYANSASGTGCTRLQQLQQSIQDDALAALAELQRRHISSIPWGNSSIHYSQHHSISTHPSAIFEKLVVRRLDGYCMENTNLLYVVLRSLGYQAYPSAGRVSNAAADPKISGSDLRYASLGHMVIIVIIDNLRYMVDVGFGNNVPTRPLPLIEDAVAINIAPTEMRLTRDSIPEAVDQTQKTWIYQVRFNPESTWVSLYAFSAIEFLPQDFDMMNFQTSKMPSSWFTQQVVCVRHILDETGGELQGLFPCVSPSFPASRTMSTSLQEKLDTLRNYSACDVSDALLKLQKPANGAPARAGYLADFSPLSPSQFLTPTPQTPKTIAPASTIKFIPKSSPLPSNTPLSQSFPPETHWVDHTEPGTIVLIEQPSDQHCAVVGGIMAARMKYLGIDGVVVNGRVRDLGEIRGSGLAVWARGTSTVGTGAEAKAGLRGVEVDVGGVVVCPGDIIFCDPLEGIVAIPRDLLDQVLELMPKLVAVDDKVKEAVEQGLSVFDAFKKFRT
ncbi:hypothetical protein BDW59DRAFT_176355 [Aspergillus cavernicola]|uniref:Arylamine N-acetyltransferase n=1 Tax=Aspergillus cavernicola TaxID=176166 RepID=A0ABR4HJ07_9EURO